MRARRFLVAPGELFRQPGLAATLRRIVTHGAEDFYSGALARRIMSDMSEHGGLLSAVDLAAASVPSIEEPLRLRLGAAELLTAPPPAGGAELVRALALLNRRAAQTQDTDRWRAAWAVAVHDAFAERERAADGRRGRQDADPHSGLAEPVGETSHLCATDDEGNIVSLTQSINRCSAPRLPIPSSVSPTTTICEPVLGVCTATASPAGLSPARPSRPRWCSTRGAAAADARGRG